MKLPIKPRTASLLTTVSNFLTKQGIKSYLVGGFIRDVLLRRDTADIDIAVAADAVEIASKVANALGGRFVLLDKVNRVGRAVVVDKEAPSGGRWELDFSTFEGSIEQDLAQRDFTIDAIAVDLGELTKDFADVHLIDPFHGQADLQQGVIRTVSETAFESDAARLLRAVRLAAELGFGLDSQTEALVQRNCHLITGVAGERLREELLRLVAVPQSERFLSYLDELGLLTAIIPELAQAKGVKQPKEHFWDVFDHSIETVIAVDFLLHEGTWKYASDEVLAIAPWSEVLAQHFALEVSSGSTRRSLLKLAALLHDVAKPQTKAIGEDGRMHFLGHAKLGAAMAVDVLERLRFSSKEVKLVEVMVREHLRPGQMSQGGLPTRRAIYRYFRDTGEAGIDILLLSLADHLATRGPQLNLARWQEHAQMVEYVLAQHFEQERLVVPPKLIDGHDLINVFGMSPGPKLGEVLEAVREAQASGELATREDALSYIREHLLSGVNRHA
ncbi:MAG: HD domain-containing protein [Dehalococcoidia bacterium]|nr:HD domain-containing protein [Dehalococcoidia bacterium]